MQGKTSKILQILKKTLLQGCISQPGSVPDNDPRAWLTVQQELGGLALQRRHLW
jgi:hypothetical protein